SVLADVIGRDETMGTQAERLEPVGDQGVVRDAAVVDGKNYRDPGSGSRQPRAGSREPELRQAVDLCFEFGHRQLVAISRGRAEAGLARIRFVHVMKQQGYGSHVASVAPPISNADMR